MSTNGCQRNLTQLVLKPTLYCYHKCPYCDQRQYYYKDIINQRKLSKPVIEIRPDGREKKLPEGHMPLDIGLKAIRDAAKLGMKSLLFSGGDPLLYPNLVELIKEGAKHQDVFVLMNSVGTRVSEEKVKEVVDAGLRAWNFSIDTLDPEMYENLRGVKGSLETILNAVDTVRGVTASNNEFFINYMTVITNKNYKELPNLVEHCIDTGVASIYLMNVYGDDTGESLLTESQICEFRKETVPSILDVLESGGAKDVVKTNALEVLNSFFAADNADSNYAKGIYWDSLEDARVACQVPNYYSLVEPNGKVLPCCLVEISHEGEVGDMNTNSLQQIWGGEDFDQFRTDRIPFCQKCPVPRNRTLGLIPEMCRQFFQ